MGKAILAAIGGLIVLLLASTIAAYSQDRYDPVENARQQAEAARLYAEVEKWEQQAEHEAYWSPIRAAVTNAAMIVVVIVLAGAVIAVVSYAGAMGVAHVRYRFHFVEADQRGLLPVPQGDVAGIAPATLNAFHVARQLEAQRQPVPASLHYAPHFSNRSDGTTGLLPAVEPAALALPGLTDLASIGFRPSREAILLGLGEGGERITVPMKALWHIGTAGPTGAGKSNIARLIIPQLQAIGAKVAIIDPKWTPYDVESGEDWRPIAQRLFLPPARKPDEIADTIGFFADELERRLELRNAGQRVGSPLFLYSDEYTTITADVKDASERMARLGRLGRGVGIFLLVAAHDLLVKSGAGDMRDQLRTGFYLGGDVKTGSVLLDMPQKAVIEQEGQLSTGVALLRSAATSPARAVRVPLASNAAIAGLLGNDAPTMPRVQNVYGEGAKEPAHDAPGTRPVHVPYTSGSDVYSAPECGKTPVNLTDASTARILAGFSAGKSVHDLAAEIGGTTNTNSRAYREARAQVEGLLRRAIGGE